MEDLLTVRRWRRYGADRLYVTQDSGRPVGSVDLQSGEVVEHVPQVRAALRAAHLGPHHPQRPVGDQLHAITGER